MGLRFFSNCMGWVLLITGLVIAQLPTEKNIDLVFTSTNETVEDPASKSENEKPKPVSLRMDNVTSTNAYWTHAPLAAFSLGSIAVGGVFYSIQNSMNGPKVGFVNSDKSSLSSAMGAAGVTALVAGAAYFYYSHRDTERAKNWNGSVSGGVAPSGDVNVSARISLPLSFVTR